jgi:hypothetical protein
MGTRLSSCSARSLKVVAGVAATTFAGLSASCVWAQSVEFPADANTLNVQAFGAIANDGGDDLAAFQAAMNATVGSSRILYVPNGTYNFSGRLNWGGIGSGGFFTLQGQSQAGVILKLDDGAAGFGDPATRLVFIDAYEGNTANQFRNYLRDVTIDIGANNPGAVGLEFQANNTGRIENVTIRSSDALKRGAVGLSQGFAFPGPMLIRNVTIDGFEEGYVGAPQEYSVVFENLTLRNQRALGMYVWRLPLQIRNLVSQNSVPVIRSHNNPGAWGHVVIDGGTLTGLPGAATIDAVVNENSAGVITLRNVTTSGYRFAVRDESFSVTTPITVPNGLVSQFTTDAPASVVPSPTQILNIPIEETPDAPAIPLSQWVSVKSFGAIENDNLDDTAAVKAAFASGAPVVYFPSGLYIISDTIEVGPSVRRIEGLMSDISINAPLTTEDKPLFRVGPDAQPVVHISGVNSSFQSPPAFGVTFEQAVANTLVIRDGDISYRNTVPGGKLFIENLVGANMTFTGQKVWARQLNPEGSTFTHITNDGGDLYILGLKTEGSSIVLNNRNRARTTVMGGLIYPSTTIADRTRPMFINNESSLSLSLPESCYITDGFYDVWVRETRNGVTTDFTRASLPLNRGHSVCGGQIALYNGYIADPASPPTPATPAVTVSDLNSITLTWPAVSPGVSGIARYNVYRNGVFYRSVMSPTLTDAGLPDGTEYTYRVSAVSGAGIESAQSSGRDASTDADETAPRIVNIRSGLDARFITLTFSEAIDVASAGVASNYSVVGPAPVSVLAAAPSSDGLSVRLTLSGMVAGTQTVSVSNVTDRATAPNAIAAGTNASFSFLAPTPGTGLTAHYYNNNSFIGAPLLTRIDPTINFIYGFGSPDPSIPADGFAARWSGKLRPRFDEPYTLSIRSDDGSRIFLDGRLIVGNWFDQGPTERGATVTLDSSRDYDLVVEYYENAFGASVELFWQSPSQPRQIIPQSALSPDSILTTVRTWQGVGADLDLNRVFPGPGTGDSMGAFHSPAAGAFHQAAYWRLDLSSLNLANHYVTDAVGTLSQTFFGIGDGKRLINVFAVNQAPGADNWIESGAGFVTWQTAAGNNDSGSQADGNTARWMSTYFLDNTGFQNNFQPDKFFFDGPRLVEAINADTDNRITFLAKRLDASNEGQSWFTKEWGTPGFAPAIKVRTAPRCPTFETQPAALTLDQAQAPTLFAVVRGVGPISYQWRLNGVAISNGPGGASPGGGDVVGASGVLAGPGSVSLTIANTQPADAGTYTLTLTNACGSATSVPVALVVNTICPCTADFDGSGGTPDAGDIDAFFSAWLAGDESADADCSGGTPDAGDIDVFFAQWLAGGC